MRQLSGRRKRKKSLIIMRLTMMERSAVAARKEEEEVVKVDVEIETEVSHALLFDPGHGLEERLIREQFA